jgi:pilus assembly protein Flp/PilA
MRSRQRGQGLIDYALILVLVAIVLVVVLTLMGHQIVNAFRDVSNTFQSP